MWCNLYGLEYNASTRHRSTRQQENSLYHNQRYGHRSTRQQENSLYHNQRYGLCGYLMCVSILYLVQLPWLTRIILGRLRVLVYNVVKGNENNNQCSYKLILSIRLCKWLKQLDSKLSPVKGFMGSNPLSD